MLATAEYSHSVIERPKNDDRESSPSPILARPDCKVEPPHILSKHMQLSDGVNDKFRKGLRDMVLRHFGLYRSDDVIAGDISAINTVQKGRGFQTMASDSHLASCGSTPLLPKTQGWECMGTKPFMAVMLLLWPEIWPGSTVTQVYQNDLESFGWCFLWYLNQNLFTERIRHGDPHIVGSLKLTLATLLGFKDFYDVDPLYKQFISLWLSDAVQQSNLTEPESNPTKALAKLLEIVQESQLQLPFDDSYPETKRAESTVPLEQASSDPSSSSQVA